MSVNHDLDAKVLRVVRAHPTGVKFKDICMTLCGKPFDRGVDRSLQRLRKSGDIYHANTVQGWKVKR